MSVLRWLQLRPDDITRSASDVLFDMQADGEPLRDSSRWTYAGLAQRFGSEEVGKIDETLKAIRGMDWVRLALAASGLDFSDDETQVGLQKLIDTGSFTPEIGSALKSLGIQSRTAWQALFGDDPLPSEAEIETAIEEHVARSAVVAALNGTIHPAVSELESGLITLEEFRSRIAGV